MIQFKNIRWKNFLSTGNQFIEVRLDKSPTTLIIGDNGSGKSTILDALTFGLFSKPFRKINKPQLVNSVNNGGTLVEIEFIIGTKAYMVRRGIKKNIFEIFVDGKRLNQDAKIADQQEYLENTILKLNNKSFTQIVVLGSASFTPFMQLKLTDRRTIIEDLLDIQIFSSMNSILKSKNLDLKNDMGTLDIDKGLYKQKIEIQEDYIKRLKEDSDSIISKKEKEIENFK